MSSMYPVLMDACRFEADSTIYVYECTRRKDPTAHGYGLFCISCGLPTAGSKTEPYSRKLLAKPHDMMNFMLWLIAPPVEP